MSPPRLKHTSSASKFSIISLSSFETSSSLDDNQFISYHHNTNNNKSYVTEKQPMNTKSFYRTLDQAVEYFEEILNQCTTPSNTSLIRNTDRQNILPANKREGEDFVRSINPKENIKQREPKINCRQWCEEQNRGMAKYGVRMNDTRNRHTFGSTFFCRKALLQKPDGTTYICIRKRLN